MRIIVFLLVLSLLCIKPAQGAGCDQWEALSAMQKGRLVFAYRRGALDDLGYTMAAIALTESNAGKWRVNLESKDVGLFQVNIKTAANTLGVTNHYKKLELAEKLIYQDTLNAYIALSVLKYFNKYHQGNWRKMVQSYNAGFNKSKGKKYVDKVILHVKMLQKCLIIN